MREPYALSFRFGVSSQSLQFLVEAEDFRKSFAASAESNDTTTFATFVGITDKYIKDSSHFEVNIDSKTKMEILAKAHEAAFKELSLVSAAEDACNNQTLNSVFRSSLDFIFCSPRRGKVVVYRQSLV